MVLALALMNVVLMALGVRFSVRGTISSLEGSRGERAAAYGDACQQLRGVRDTWLGAVGHPKP